MRFVAWTSNSRTGSSGFENAGIARNGFGSFTVPAGLRFVNRKGRNVAEMAHTGASTSSCRGRTLAIDRWGTPPRCGRRRLVGGRKTLRGALRVNPGHRLQLLAEGPATRHEVDLGTREMQPQGLSPAFYRRRLGPRPACQRGRPAMSSRFSGRWRTHGVGDRCRPVPGGRSPRSDRRAHRRRRAARRPFPAASASNSRAEA